MLRLNHTMHGVRLIFGWHLRWQWQVPMLFLIQHLLPVGTMVIQLSSHLWWCLVARDAGVWLVRMMWRASTRWTLLAMSQDAHQFSAELEGEAAEHRVGEAGVDLIRRVSPQWQSSQRLCQSIHICRRHGQHGWGGPLRRQQ